MFDALIEACQTRGIRRITGIYIPSKKNGMVADFYQKLGFAPAAATEEGYPKWQFDVPTGPRSREAKHITRESKAIAIVPNGNAAAVEPATAR
jgi:predicted enzyme involved in methoxymalonyl-ACP biosynthesis